MASYDAHEQLLNRYFEGSITGEELKQLEELLLGDDAFARDMGRWCVMHRQIGELLSEDQLHELMDRFATSSPALRQDVFRLQPKTRMSSAGRGKNVLAWPVCSRLRAATLAAAATMLIAASFAFWHTHKSVGDSLAI